MQRIETIPLSERSASLEATRSINIQAEDAPHFDHGGITTKINNELLYGNKKLNTNGMPKTINDLIMAPMRMSPNYKDHCMRAAPGLFQTPKFKNNHPLFILRLHFQLRKQPQHIQIFQLLTEKAWEYILYEIRRFSDKINEERWDKDILYIKKLNAYKNLLYYLRHQRMPTKKNLDDFIQCGIYGARKGKNNSKRANIDDYAAQYAQGNEDNEEDCQQSYVEIRINADEEDISERLGLWLNAQDDI